VIVSFLGLGAACAHIGSDANGDNPLKFEARIEWIGAVTRPPIEATLATKDGLERAKQWAAGEPGYRKFAILSDDEVKKIKLLLKSQDFELSRRTTEPDFRIQQYVIRVEFGDTPEYFVTGLGRTTISRLEDLQGVLSKTSSAAIQPLVDELKEFNK